MIQGGIQTKLMQRILNGQNSMNKNILVTAYDTRHFIRRRQLCQKNNLLNDRTYFGFNWSILFFFLNALVKQS